MVELVRRSTPTCRWSPPSHHLRGRPLGPPTRGPLGRSRQRKVDPALAALRGPRRRRCAPPRARGPAQHGGHPAHVRVRAGRAGPGGPPPHRAARGRRRPRPRGRVDPAGRAQVADLTLLGDEQEVRARRPRSGSTSTAPRRRPSRSSDLVEPFAEEYARLRAHRGMTLEQARDVVRDVSYFGTMMVHRGHADGMVSGAAHSTAAHHHPGVRDHQDRARAPTSSRRCSSWRWPTGCSCTATAPSSPTPTAEQLADIAVPRRPPPRRSASSLGSRCCPTPPGRPGAGADVDKVRAATELVRERRPDLPVDGPLQYDAAVDAAVAEPSCPARPWRAGPRCSCSPTSTPATTPTRRSSARPAPSPSARSCRAWTSRSTTCPWRHRPRHRQHRRDHRHAGPGRAARPADASSSCSTRGRRRSSTSCSTPSRARLASGLVERIGEAARGQHRSAGDHGAPASWLADHGGARRP